MTSVLVFPAVPAAPPPGSGSHIRPPPPLCHSVTLLRLAFTLLASALQGKEREASPRSQQAVVGQLVSVWSEIALLVDLSLRFVFIIFYYLMVRFLT